MSVDLCVEGERTSPHSTETFPGPAELDTVKVIRLSAWLGGVFDPVKPELYASAFTVKGLKA